VKVTSIFSYRWSKEDFNNLYWYFTKCSTSTDPIAKISEMYGDASGKTREAVRHSGLIQLRLVIQQTEIFNTRCDSDYRF
jgi:hypothetical protein